MELLYRAALGAVARVLWIGRVALGADLPKLLDFAHRAF